MSEVTVAIPVRDGGPLFQALLAALARQTVPHEVLVCDSGSRDGSSDAARELGARVLEIPAASFSHGGTRNLLMEHAHGARVAFLSQDAEPVGERWLERLLAGMELAPDVGIAYGPYRPRPDAPAAVRVELERWFASLAPDSVPAVERLSAQERATLPARAFVGRRGFFTDANSCIARSAWERVRFREVPYAEDRVLAIDMMRAGYAKAFVPDAPVLHSHAYTPTRELRRCFDEWRALLEIYGWREPASPRALLGRLRGELGPAGRALAGAGAGAREQGWASRQRLRVAALAHHLARLAGALLGSRADRLPARLRGLLSLEGRSAFAPLALDAPAALGADRPEGAHRSGGGAS